MATIAEAELAKLLGLYFTNALPNDCDILRRYVFQHNSKLYLTKNWMFHSFEPRLRSFSVNNKQMCL